MKRTRKSKKKWVTLLLLQAKMIVASSRMRISATGPAPGAGLVPRPRKGKNALVALNSGAYSVMSRPTERAFPSTITLSTR